MCIRDRLDLKECSYDEREEKKEGAKLMGCEMLTCHFSEKKERLPSVHVV